MRASESQSAERVVLAFRRAIAAVLLFNDQVSLQVGMSVTESQFMHLLQLNGSLSPSDLSRESGLSSGTVTGIVDRLEELGFVRRERHPSDRRKVAVVLDEDRVNEELAPLFSDQSARLDAVIGQFRPAQLAVIADFLEGLLAE